jgi:hypothetical protein
MNHYDYGISMQIALHFSAKQMQCELQEFELLAFEAACRSIQQFNLYWEKALKMVVDAPAENSSEAPRRPETGQPGK